MSEPFTINIVCTGNTCRSPIAEALLKKALREHGIADNVRVESSGISAMDGTEASEGALAVVEEKDASLEGFSSTRLTHEIAERTHLFLVMERFHRDFIEEMFPFAADKVRLFRSYLEPSFSEDIPDPVGGDERIFAHVTRMIETAITTVVKDWDAVKYRFYENQKLVVAVGADHRGFENKQRMLDELQLDAHPLIDCGTQSSESCDHPNFAFQVSQLVALGAADRGILICGSGHGMVISANKTHGARAIMPFNATHAMLSRQHNNANVLCLASDFMLFEDMVDSVRAWLNEPFLGGKYQRRINMILDYERLGS